MKCMACGRKVVWTEPIIYMDFDRAVHVSEFMKFIGEKSILRSELEKTKLEYVEETPRVRPWDRDIPEKWPHVYPNYSNRNDARDIAIEIRRQQNELQKE